MALKKFEIHSSLRRSCADLRCGMDASQHANISDCNNSSTSGSGTGMAERFINRIAIFENKALDFTSQEVTA